MKYALFLIALLVAATSAQAQAISVHDPVMIQHDSTYYLFATGRGIDVWASDDMKTWHRQKPVFDVAPSWCFEAVKGFRGHIWAPDISFHNGRYYLYYSVSAFGKNTSAIGVATNKTLDPNSPDFAWKDGGMVLQSVPNRDMWNAIDPNLIVDSAGTGWLTFGSFWDGIKMVRLNADMARPAEPQEWHSVCRRERSFTLPDDNPGDGAVEAPFVFRKGEYYYLFVSFDYCCRGLKSTYKVVVGRARNVTGPYLDHNGNDMAYGGGSILAEGDSIFAGVGHNAVCSFNGHDYLVMHGYSRADNGRPLLVVKELLLENGEWKIKKEK